MTIRELSCSATSDPISYDIVFHQGILNNPKVLATKLKSIGSRFAIITNDNLVHEYGTVLQQTLMAGGLESHIFTFPKGEKNKSRKSKDLLEDSIMQNGMGRDTCIIGIGGGAVTDMAGYIAATYCRGIPLVLIPTSLLGMIDASIGGKNGINTRYGKNMIGTIYPPKKIIIDISSLSTLPLCEVKNGVVEMIKHGLIADSTHFDFLDAHIDSILSINPKNMERAIFDSCRTKISVVTEDEKEAGRRRILNFGHTVGHALELISNFSIAHGEAVAMGILAESHISLQLGYLKQNEFDRIQNILLKYKFTKKSASRHISTDLINLMILDKKSLNGNPRFVIIDRIGSALPCDGAYCLQVSNTIIKNALQWTRDALHCY